jgi:hypothetical protein
MLINTIFKKYLKNVINYIFHLYLNILILQICWINFII